MKLHDIQDRPPKLIRQLLVVWESSVRATHDFLSEEEVMRIKGYVPQALQGVAHLTVAEDAAGVPVAFMSIEGQWLEMLFLTPAARGRGLGKQLLRYGIEQHGVRKVTVNEQNPQAIGSYEHLGFSVYRRTDCDEEGGPYPLLYLRL